MLADVKEDMINIKFINVKGKIVDDFNILKK